MPDQKLRRKIARQQQEIACQQQEIACLKAVQQALYRALDNATRAGHAASFEAGAAEGAREALDFDSEVRDLLEGEA